MTYLRRKKTEKFPINEAHQSSGLATIPIIVILSLIIIAIAASMMTSSFIESLVSRTLIETEKSFYLSDSGIDDALLKIARNKNLGKDVSEEWNLPTSGTDKSNIVVSGTATTRIIDSVGIISEKQKNLETKVTLDEEGKITATSWKGMPEIWYNPSWRYRRKMTITENSGNAVTNFPVEVTINTKELVDANKMQADGDDIRIITSTGKEIPYQIREETMNTDSTEIWFLVDLVASEIRSDIYLYYGNPSATAPDYSDQTDLEYTTGPPPEGTGHFENSKIYAHIGTNNHPGNFGFDTIYSKDVGVDIVNNYSFLFNRKGNDPVNNPRSVDLVEAGPIYVELSITGSGYVRNDGPLVYRLYAYNQFIRWMANKTGVTPGTHYWFGWDNSVLDTFESNGTSYTLTPTDTTYTFDNITYPYIREMRTSDNYSFILLAPSTDINKAAGRGDGHNGEDEEMGLSNMTSNINLPWMDYWVGKATTAQCQVLSQQFSAIPTVASGPEETY